MPKPLPPALRLFHACTASGARSCVVSPTQARFAALESALPPLHVSTKILQFMHNPDGDDGIGCSQLLAGIEQVGEVYYRVVANDGLYSAELWAAVASLRENVGDAGMVQQACKDLVYMTENFGEMIMIRASLHEF